MCQLNVYIFSNDITIEEIKKDMNKLGIENYDQISNDFSENHFLDDCYFFISPAYRCHCGSQVSSFDKSYYRMYTLNEMIKKEQDRKSEKIRRMKEFIARESYEKEKEIFLEQESKIIWNSPLIDENRTKIQEFYKDNQLMSESTKLINIETAQDPVNSKKELLEIVEYLHYFASIYGEIRYISYWQSNETPKVKRVTKVNLSELSIELLATLDEGELIVIK